MEISFLGHSCFRLKTKEMTVLIDPFDPKEVGLKFPAQKADIVIVSHQHSDHNYVTGVVGPIVRDEVFVIDKPGEFEVGGVEVRMFNSYHDKKEGEERGRNLISVIRTEEIFLVHLGDLGHKLSEKRLADLGSVDVLMLPVGGSVTLDAKLASELVLQLEPAIVIPMHYKEEGLSEKYQFLDEVSEFLKSMGGEVPFKDKKLKLSKSDLEVEETKVVVLEV